LTHTLTSNVEQICALIEQCAAAVRRKDMDDILRNHIRDFVMVDLFPPLDLQGIEACHNSRHKFFENWRYTPASGRSTIDG
jgi:ketosteroid isomerase-like protein